MTRWGIVADLNRCVGCQTCTAACKHANATAPGIQWRKVLDVEAGEFPDVRRAFVPVGCMHCDDPPCMTVCPTTATRKRGDGIVTIDYDLCIGCAYCAVACPYQARTRLDAPTFAYGAKAMAHELAREDPARIGVAQKCTLCADRIDAGLAAGKVPGSDAEATPACVGSCIAGALTFGDLDDPDSPVSQLLATHRHFRMHEELGTGPGFHYLYAPADGPADDDSGPWLVADSIGQAAVAPRQQHNWDGRAAANFIAGGAGGGLAMALAAMALAGQAPPGWLGLVAMALVGAGLFSVWAEIGRPWRFLNVFLNPQTSWMTREALAAMAFFATGLAGVVFAMPGLIVLSGLLAGIFVYCQARIIAAATGIPAWREPAIVPLIAVTGLAEGAGLVLIAGLLPAGAMAIGWPVAMALILLVVLRLVCWRTYRSRLGARGAPTATLDTLARFSRPFEVAGHIAPVALLGYGLVVPAVADIAYAAGGALVLAAGGAFKFVLVCRAGFNQGYAVARLPARGAGTSAPGIKPGWKTVPK